MVQQIFPSSYGSNQPAGNFTNSLASTPLKFADDEDVEMAISYLSLWYTLTNIGPGNNILETSLDGTTWNNTTIQTGLYNLGDNPSGSNSSLNQDIQLQLAILYGSSYGVGSTGGYISVGINPGSQQCVIQTYPGSSSTYPKVRFTSSVSSLYLSLGFPTGELSDGVNLSSTPVLLGDALDSFFISSDIVQNQYNLANVNGNITYSNSFYSNSWNVGANQFQVIQPPFLTWIPVKGRFINSINIQITNRKGQILDFNQGGNYNTNSVSMTLLFRSVKKSK